MAEYSKNFEKLENSSVELSLTFPAAAVEEAYRPALEKYARQLTVKGFRKGKAPVSLIESKYGDTILGESFSDLLDGAINEVFTSEDDSKRAAQEFMPLDPRGLAFVNESEVFPLSRGKDIVCRFRYDVHPQFELGARKGLSVPYWCDDYDPAVEGERLEEIRQRLSVVVEKKEGGAEPGDIVTADIVQLDETGAPVEATREEDRVLNLRAKGSDPEGIEDELAGMKAGEVKTVAIEGGEGSSHPGQTLTWRLEVKKLRVRDVPALDDDFAQDADEKYKTLEDMKEDIHKTMFAEYEENRDMHKVTAALDQIASGCDIVVPDTLLNNAVYDKWVRFLYQMGGGASPEGMESMEKRLASAGLTFDGFASNLLKGPGREDLLAVVKRSLVLAKLVYEEKLGDATDEEIKAYIKEQGGSEEMEAGEFEKEKDMYKDDLVNERARRFLLDNNEFVLTEPPKAPEKPEEPAEPEKSEKPEESEESGKPAEPEAAPEEAR